MHRDSALTSVLRAVQNKYPYFRFLDCLVRPFLQYNGNIGLLCILAPPRSGSTLTYQLLTTAFTGWSLRNISNFLFATPGIGYIATKTLCRNYQTSFCSQQGFVSGICGEAEGMKFWKYWLGQGLEQRTDLLNITRLRGLKRCLDRTGESVMITGYLGHIFAISALRKVFPKVLFIHLQRDLLSNAYSLLELTNGLNPFSTCPAWVKAKNHESRHHLVIEQVQGIHDIILAEHGEDMIQIRYEDLCDNPEGTLWRIEKKAKQLGIYLKRKGSVPKPFAKQVFTPDHDEDSAQLHQIIKAKY